ncbi:MAG: SurA N-terminal domain-containing protein [Aliidongia sp.]
MLQFIRSKAGSFFVKLLFVLLIGSFGIWGVGDFLRQSPRDTTLISVGSDTIEADRVQAAYRQTLEQMRRRFGSSLDPEQARALGLIDRTVDDLVGQTLFDQEAKRLNVAVGDAQIAASIAAIPGVASGGKVDRIQIRRAPAADRHERAAIRRRAARRFAP